MPTTYQIELPGGKTIEIESVNPLDESGIKRAVNMASSGDLYQFDFRDSMEKAVADAKTRLVGLDAAEPDPRRAVYSLAAKFDNAQVGDQINDPITGRDFIKTGENTFALPGYDKEMARKEFAKASPEEAATQAAMLGALPGVGAMSAVGVSGKALANTGVLSRFLGPILAGGATGMGLELAERKAIEKINPEAAERISQVQEDQPTASLAGSLLGGSVPVQRISTAAGSTLAKQLASRGIGAGLGGGIQTGMELAQGDLDQGALSRIALATGAGAAFNEPTGLGRIAERTGAGAAEAVASSLQQIKSRFSKPDIAAQLGQVKAGDPLPKATEAANSINAGQSEDFSGFQPVEARPPLELPDQTPQQALTSLALERRADPLGSIELGQKAPEVSSASETILAKREQGDQAQQNINELLGVTSKPQVAADTLLGQQLASEATSPVKVNSTIADAAQKVEAARTTAFNKRVTSVQENLANEGVVIDRQTASKIALLKTPEEFNAARQQLIDSVKTNEPDVPSSGPMKGLDELNPSDFPLTERQGLTGQSRRESGEIPREIGEGEAINDAQRIRDEQALKRQEMAPEAPVVIEEAPATFVGIQEGLPDAGIPDIELFNLTSDIPGHPKDSTVSRQTFEAAGFSVPPKPKAEPKKKGLGNNEAGFANQAVLANIAAPAVGAVVGSTQGDSIEERGKNALLFAAAASGSTLALTKLAKSPNLMKSFKQGIEEAKTAKAQAPTTYEHLTLDPNSPKLAPANVAASKAMDMVDNHKAYKPIFDSIPLGDMLSNLGIVVDNVRAVHPEIAGGVRDMAQFETRTLSDAYDKVMPPLLELRKLVGTKQFEEIGRLLQNGHEDSVLPIIESLPGGKEIADGIRDGWMKVRDELYQAIQEVRPGDGIKKREAYWPTKVADIGELNKILGKEETSMIHDALESALAAKRKIDGPSAQLTPDEESAAVSDLISRSTQAPGKPGNLKPRTIETIEKNMAKIYEPLDVSIDRYLAGITHDIAVRKFLGKIDPNASSPWVSANSNEGGPIGAKIAELIKRGEIDNRGANILKENINAYINRPSSSSWGVKAADLIGFLQTAGNLGQMINVLGQLQDVFTTAVNRTPGTSFPAFLKSIVKGKGLEKLENIGLHEGNAEVGNYARGRGRQNQLLDIILSPFFKWSDRVGKEGFLTATREWAEMNVKSDKPSAKFQQTAQQHRDMFGDVYWNKVVNAFKEQDWTSPEYKKFLFNEISNVQPTTRADMPLGKLKTSGFWKVAWGLTSFQLRQMGRAKSQVVDEWRKGNKEAAAAWGATYLFWMAVGNSTLQFIRDVYNGKDDVSLGDYAFGSMLQALGGNKVMVSQMTKGNFAEAVGDRVVPGIAPIARDVHHDFGEVRDLLMGNKTIGESESDLVRRVPWLGDLYYKQFGRGKKLQQEKARTRTEEKTDLQKLEDSILGDGNRQK